MALQILNLGVDAIDFQPLSASASLGDFNYINSLTEYVSEILLGHKDAFPEYQKESSSSKSQFTKHFSIKLCELNTITIITKLTDYHSAYVLINEKEIYRFCKEINLPPPKV
jgi:hypothetical protein